MLSFIRKNANSIWIKAGLFVVASTFLFFFGMTDVINKITGNDYIIKVGNVKIGPNLFKLEARKQAEKLKKIGIADETQIMNIVLLQMVDDEIYQQMMQRYGIYVDEMLVKQYMYAIPMFRCKDGSLNRGAIRTFMGNMDMRENEFISFLRKDVQGMLLGFPLSMCVAKSVVSAAIQASFEKRNVKYIYMPYDSFAIKQVCTDEDLEECYKLNTDKFLIEEKRNFEVLIISEDSILKQVNVSDKDIAEEYKLRAETEDFEKVKESIRADLIKAEFDSKLNDLIRCIEDDFAASISCEEIAKKYKIQKSDFKEITRDYVSPKNNSTALPAELMQAVIKTAFSLETGQESSFVEGLDRNNKKIQWLVRTSSIIPAHPKKLASVKNEVARIWLKEKQKEAAIEHIKGVQDTINSGVAIDFIGEKYGYIVNELNDITHGDKISDIKFKKAAHMNADLLNKIVHTAALHANYVLADEGAILFEVMDVTAEKNIDAKKASKVGKKVSAEYARELFQQLKSYNKKKIGVKINKKLLHSSSETPMADVDF